MGDRGTIRRLLLANARRHCCDAFCLHGDDMSVIADALVTVPTTVIKGQIFEIRTLVRHDMESGFRHTEQGVRVPRRIIREFSCMYNDLEVFRATLYPGTSANPMFVFYCRGLPLGRR
ncbi:MAG: thiosulfate oxidation carrier complex protein SoxZ [Betaproteobacteria bacterium]|nr:thiosulfate oxidation carrier complex protein SoxZ [Betaproteobacteria bacterium]